MALRCTCTEQHAGCAMEQSHTVSTRQNKLKFPPACMPRSQANPASSKMNAVTHVYAADKKFGQTPSDTNSRNKGRLTQPFGEQQHVMCDAAG